MKRKATAKPSSDAAQVRAYLSALPPRSRAALRQIRALIRGVAPDAVDAFSYRMPVTRLDGKVLVWYAAFTHHVSLFPIGPATRRAAGVAEGRFKVSKGTIQFPLDEPIPQAVITRIVKARAAEIRRAAG